MNSLTAEKRYQFAKWAEIIKSCKSSGIQQVSLRFKIKRRYLGI